MAIYHEDIVDIELESGTIHRSFLHHSIGCGDDDANRFGIRAFRNGAAETLGGTCAGYFIRADGNTVVIADGVVSGNMAYVTLPEACYAVEGQFTLAIKVSGSGVTGTMRIVDGVVSRTSTSATVDPGTLIDSIEDLIDAIEAAVASVPAEYDDVWTTFAPNFSSSTAYTKDQYVTYDGALYRFTTDHAAGSWNSSHVTAVNVGNELVDQKNALVFEDTMQKKALKFEDALQNAKREKRNASISLSDVTLFQKGHYMEADGSVSEAANHNIHVIEDAETINQIRFVQLATANAPLFIVKDKDGDVVKTYTPSQSGFNDFEYSCLAIPGGLPEGSKIFINYFYENNDHAKVVTDITICFEPQLKNKAHGKDLFDYTKALELSGCYYGYDTGVQVKSATYCAGEARVVAGDKFITSKTCHIAYYDEYGTYISGELNSTGWYKEHTAPEGTAGAIVSFKTSEVDVAEVLIDEIHFTVPVNQKILEDGENSSTYVDDETSVTNVNAVLKLPKTYSENGAPVPLIIIFHGAGFYVSASNWGVSSDGTEGSSADFDNMMQFFVYSGYAVCDINAYDNTVPNRTFGSQRTILAYKKLHEYVKDHYNVEQEPNGFGFSMGGLVALNYINEFHDLKCLALASPVVALYKQGYYGSATWKQAIATSYGLSVPSGFEFSSGTPTEAEQTIWEDNEDLTNGYDPLVRANADAANTLYPFMRIWHGDSDTAVSYMKSQEFAEDVRGKLAECTHRVVTGAGHEICYGGSGVCNREYIRYFNRFNHITGITPR